MPADQLGTPVWYQVTDFPFDGLWYRQEQDFYLVRVDSWDVDLAGLDEGERDSIDTYHWWSVAELETTRERFYPDPATPVHEPGDPVTLVVEGTPAQLARNPARYRFKFAVP